MSQIGQTSATFTLIQTEYECDLCKDEEWIFDLDTNTAKHCKCREAKLYKRIIESCGITESFLEKNFDNYIPNSKQTESLYKTARDYANTFEWLRKTKCNSLALLGQVGSGKTHLTIAVANELMKRNIGVRYMQYREDIPKIKRVVTSDEDYTREINKYKNAAVLLIDDLYKNAVVSTPNGEYLNEADKRIIFEIINHRYFKQLPVIVSSEYPVIKLLEFDEGIGSRIVEMCNGHLYEVKGKENNYRMRRQGHSGA